jgi:hypothetical protein
MKICQVGDELLQTERRTSGRTDRHESKPIVAFHNSANTSETILYEGKVKNIEKEY